MKILHIVESLDPENGGPSVSVPNLAAAQLDFSESVALAYACEVSRVKEIEVVCSSHITAFQSLERLPILYKKGVFTLLIKFIGWIRLLKNIRDFDFVHIHGVWTVGVTIVALYCALSGKNYAICPRGMLDQWSLKQSSIKKKISLFVVWRYILNTSSFLHALNKDEMHSLNSLKLKSSTVISPNGISVDVICSINSILIDFDLNERYVLFLSRLHRKKRADLVIRSFSAVSSGYPGLKLKIAGPDEGELEGLLKLVEELGVGDRVDFLGPVYGSEKYKLIKGALMFCLPSMQEGFSMTLLEVLACGVPLVISDGCNFPEVASSGAGLVTSQDVSKLSAALEFYLDHPESREESGKKGIELVHENYLWKPIAKNLIKDYQVYL